MSSTLDNVIIRNLFASNYGFIKNETTTETSCNNITIEKYIDIKSENNSVFLPCMCQNSVPLSVLQNLYDTKGKVKIKTSLYYNAEINIKNSITSMINYICKAPAKYKLIKINTEKDTIYGGNGVILDSKFNPVMLCGVKYKLEKNRYPEPEEGICYISNLAYNKNTIVSKIIKKIINCLASHEILYNFNTIRSSIIIKDINDFFSTPTIVMDKYDSYDTFNENIWDFLSKNKEEITEISQ